MDMFLRVAAGTAGCAVLLAAADGVRELVHGLQAGSTITLAGAVQLGVGTVCTVAVLVGACHVVANGRRGLQRIGEFVGTAPARAAAGGIVVCAAISHAAYLSAAGRWLELIFPAVTAAAGVATLRSAARRNHPTKRDDAGLGPDMEKLP